MSDSRDDDKEVRIPYESPKLFDLGGGVAHAAAPCMPGGSPAGQHCSVGTSATGDKCEAGGTAGSKCQHGAMAAGAKCQQGNAAADKCQSGGSPGA